MFDSRKSSVKPDFLGDLGVALVVGCGGAFGAEDDVHFLCENERRSG